MSVLEATAETVTVDAKRGLPRDIAHDVDSRALLDSAPIGIHWLNAEGVILWANRADIEFLGYASHEYIGRRIAEFYVDKRVIEDLIERMKRGESLKSYEVRLRHKDGSVRIAALDSSSHWHAGEFVHARCFTRDITIGKYIDEQTRAQFEELENIYRTAPIGLGLIDEELRFLRINERLAEINGISRAQHLGRTVRELVPALADQAEAMCRRVFRTGEPVLDVEFRGETPAQPGVQRVWSESWYPIKSPQGKTIGINVVVEEITERKRAEATLAETLRIKDALYKLTDALHRAQSLDDMYSAALAAIASALRCQRASILLFDSDGVMRFVGSHGLSAAYCQAVEGHSPWQHDTPDAAPICIEDVETACFNSELSAAIKSEGIGSLAFIPLTTGGRLIGKFMAYFDTAHAFRADEIEVGLAISRQLAFGIDHKRSEQALRRHARQLALISDTAPVFIAHCDLDSRFKFVNKAYAARFGLQPEQCIGLHASEILGADAFAALEKYIAVVCSGAAVEFDIEIPYDTLGERFVHCSYTPERDRRGNVVGWVCAITDITERRSIENALRMSEERLKESDRRKDEFLAMLAHELRNPLAPIANAVHLLRSDPNESPVQQQARAIIERQSGRLARLVDDLLEVSRITTGRIRLQMDSISVGGIIERASETVRPLIEQHRHTLEVSLPREALWVRGDAARLEQVMVNLLTNAAKYTDDGGRIVMSARAEGESVLLQVMDSGIGISPDLLPRVFDLFTQSERSLDRSHGGLGIGLSLVQRLVAMHGGNVSATSLVGEGSEFTVRLPITPPPPVAQHDATPTALNATNPLRVLVVDDNIDAAKSLAMLMELSGHHVALAHDGLEALEGVASHRPDIVFLDIGLPKLTGYGVAEALRQDGQSAVLVAVTGYGQASDRERARVAGFDHHLVKPVDFAQVERILKDVGNRTRP
ncbi:MAG TPA: PAS domain-containing protein [Steroidobacteraceae bacterium]|nr:PAS domain-containing protein [Steroidobacteraceae bacterium]